MQTLRDFFRRLKFGEFWGTLDAMKELFEERRLSGALKPVRKLITKAVEKTKCLPEPLAFGVFVQSGNETELLRK
jgi:hypothetical protein